MDLNTTSSGSLTASAIKLRVYFSKEGKSNFGLEGRLITTRSIVHFFMSIRPAFPPLITAWPAVKVNIYILAG